MRNASLVATLLIGLCLVSAPISVAPAIGPIRRETFDEAFWSSTTIVVAKVVDCTAPFDAMKPSYIELEPIATLCGSLDPAKTKVVVAELWCGQFDLVLNRPAIGKNVLVLLRHQTNGGNDHEVWYWVERDICRFMPEGLSLVEMDGLTDQRIAEVITAVRKLRADSSGEKK